MGIIPGSFFKKDRIAGNRERFTNAYQCSNRDTNYSPFYIRNILCCKGNQFCKPILG